MKTDTALMQAKSRVVEGVADDLTAMLNRLMSNLEPLFDQWKGSAAGSFQEVRSNFDTDMGKLNASLRIIAEAVASAGTDYTVSDDELKSDMTNAGATAGEITAALKLN